MPVSWALNTAAVCVLSAILKIHVCDSGVQQQVTKPLVGRAQVRQWEEALILCPCRLVTEIMKFGLAVAGRAVDRA